MLPPSTVLSRSTTHSASKVSAIDCNVATDAAMSSSFNPGVSPSGRNGNYKLPFEFHECVMHYAELE